MRHSIFALTLSVAALAAPAGANAQTSPQAPPAAWPAPDLQPAPSVAWPDPPAPATPPAAAPPPAASRPRAVQGAPAAPSKTAPTSTAPQGSASEAAPARSPAARRKRPARAPAAQAKSVSCAGPFASTTSHAQLEAAFGAKNVVYTQVDAPEGAKLNASVIFPNDPKRRLEVLWQDEQGRAQPSAIVITGASQWAAPGGLRLGMPLPDVERHNGKPFTLSGFGWDYGGSATDWEGGKLDQPAGSCRIGLRFALDATTTPETRGKVDGDRPFLSNDAAIRAAKPKVSEIVIGYAAR